MAKPKGVVKLHHRKLKHLEVHLYEDEETKKVTGQMVNWQKGQVTTFQEKQEKSSETP